MNKDKLKRYLVYKQTILNLIDSVVPNKHKDHPKSYLAYLNNELRIVNASIEKLKNL